jgi:hypothetical protein
MTGRCRENDAVGALCPATVFICLGTLQHSATVGGMPGCDVRMAMLNFLDGRHLLQDGGKCTAEPDNIAYGGLACIMDRGSRSWGKLVALAQ